MLLKIVPLLLLASASRVSAYHGADLPPGPYCGLPRPMGGCCKNRLDECSHKILDTLCYCDDFCKKNRPYDDCCPDYEAVCEGQIAENILEAECFLGTKKTDKCNQCICELNQSGAPSWQCEKEPCMISDDVIKAVNRGGQTWRAANYTLYFDKKLKDGLIYRLGTLPLDVLTERMYPVHYDKLIDYPTQFDARQRWPRFISPIVDQGWCGSDWAVSIASIASDRYAIQSNGAEQVLLSPQSLLSCSHGQRGCSGGHVDSAWHFSSKYGLVDEQCFPYTAKKTHCPYNIRGTLLQAGCKPVIETRTAKYRTSVPYRLSKEIDVMWDIMESGPVQAIMKVYQDFFHYRDGVYRHTPFGDDVMVGLHSVKILGWGEERGQKYWLVANSWGEDWGENGYFRIARGVNECDIERFIISGFSDVHEARRK